MSNANVETYKYFETGRLIERTVVFRPNFATDRLEIQIGPRILELTRDQILTFINNLELNLELLNKVYRIDHPIDKSKERIFLAGLNEIADRTKKQTLARMKGI